jgi:hypothetical protein
LVGVFLSTGNMKFNAENIPFHFTCISSAEQPFLVKSRIAKLLWRVPSVAGLLRVGTQIKVHSGVKLASSSSSGRKTYWNKINSPWGFCNYTNI